MGRFFVVTVMHSDEMRGAGKLPRKMCGSTSTETIGSRNTAIRRIHRR